MGSRGGKSPLCKEARRNIEVKKTQSGKPRVNRRAEGRRGRNRRGFQRGQKRYGDSRGPVGGKLPWGREKSLKEIGRGKNGKE